MRIILYLWGSNTEDTIKENLIEIGHEIIVFAYRCEHYTKDLKFAQELVNLVHDTDAQGVISFDYFPIISMVCNTVGIPYYSWIYDSPHYTLYAKTAGYECNHIGCFDRALTQRLNGLGVNTVRHLPLGVDWRDRDNNVYSDADTEIDDTYGDKNSESVSVDASGTEKYSCDVSFVGSLYTGAYDYYDSIDDELLKKRADEIVNRQCFDYEHDYTGEFFRCNCESRDITGCIDVDTKIDLQARVKDVLIREELLLGDEYIEDIEYIFEAYFLDKRVTIEERKRLLNCVAGLGYDFKLYTGSDLKDEPLLKEVCRGYVDYHEVMPLVFKNSRINLNITLRSIKTGIPLRALDIMGCGGFLLTDYREEIAECFEDGRELVIYRGLEDCIDKIRYYLYHEDERRQIAAAGQRAVRERFDCRKQLKSFIL